MPSPSPLPVKTIPSVSVPSSSSASGPPVLIRTQLLKNSGWELRWVRPENPVAKYRIDERHLSPGGSGESQTTWRPRVAPKIVESGDSVAAQVEKLDGDQLHVLKVSALGADGTLLWESPAVALATPAAPAQRERYWLLTFGAALAALAVLRWRQDRVAA